MVLYFLFVLTFLKDCFDLPGLINAPQVSLTQRKLEIPKLSNASQNYSFQLFFPSVVMFKVIFVTEAIVKSKWEGQLFLTLASDSGLHVQGANTKKIQPSRIEL